MLNSCLGLIVNDFYFLVTSGQSLAICFWKIVWKGEGFGFVVWEFYFDVLEGVVNGVVALEVEEACGWAHGADWGDEADSLATIVEITCSLSLNSQRNFLYTNIFTGVCGINDSGIGISHNQEICLSRGAGILAPKPLQINGTMITTISFEPKDTINLNIGAFLLLIVKGITAALNAIVLRTLREVDNVNEVVVGLVEGVGPERVVVDAVGAEV